MQGELVIDLITAVSDEVRLLVGELEASLSSNYPAEQRHGLPLAAIFQPHIKFFVARVGGKPAGCGGVALFDGFAELKRMYVRPHFRGQGAASAVLARLQVVARESGRRLLRLETGTLQHAALRFYQREGFSACGAFGNYAELPQPTIAGSVFMHKTLPP